MSVKSDASAPQSGLNERFARVLSQKKGPDAVMVGVLCVALVLGLVGLALHVLWIVAIIVMALGLGFALANRRRDRIDVVNRSADDADRSHSA
jgi:Flp pilus assembly protein TadB